LWYWIDRTMLAAVLMAGLAIRDYTGSPRGANEVNSEGEEPREKA
jgi:hypothetical protein